MDAEWRTLKQVWIMDLAYPALFLFNYNENYFHCLMQAEWQNLLGKSVDERDFVAGLMSCIYFLKNTLVILDPQMDLSQQMTKRP